MKQSGSVASKPFFFWHSAWLNKDAKQYICTPDASAVLEARRLIEREARVDEACDLVCKLVAARLQIDTNALPIKRRGTRACVALYLPRQTAASFIFNHEIQDVTQLECVLLKHPDTEIWFGIVTEADHINLVEVMTVQVPCKHHSVITLRSGTDSSITLCADKPLMITRISQAESDCNASHDVSNVA
ncbi:MAG: hypothetical protein WC787_01660 [Patescibacteria group bacterium]|jgi:hypothetical protein